MIEVVFDIETMNLFGDNGASEPSHLGVSVVSAYRRETDRSGKETKGEMKSFWPPFAQGFGGARINEADFVEKVGGETNLDLLWEWFNGADRIIGFNSLGFDVPALAVLYAPGNIYSLPHFDILEKVKNILGHRLSLDAIAKETLGYTKIDDGLNAVEYWRSQKPEDMARLRKYCEMDVVVTTDVYKYALKYGRLKYKDKWNEVREVEVDFSYPKIEAAPELQMGLF